MDIDYKDIDEKLTYLVYSPPKSNSMGHAVRSRNLMKVLSETLKVFQDNLGAEINPLSSLQVNLSLVNSNNDEQAKITGTVSIMNEFFQMEGKGSTPLSYTGFKFGLYWEISDKTIADVLGFIERNKGNILSIDNFIISSSYRYGNKNTPNGLINCSIESGRLFVRLRLILPYSTDDPMLFTLLRKLSNGLPFKLNSKHFRMLGTKKYRYGQWKLNIELLEQVEMCLR